MSKTAFAALEQLAPGEPLSSDGYAFQDTDRAVIDRLLRLGAVTHKHDAHAALADPTTAPTAAVAPGSGSIDANTAISLAYTLLDPDGGETAPVATLVVNTGSGYGTPTGAPTLALDHTAGTRLAGTDAYAITVTDGVGGETVIGPPAFVEIPPGFANSETVVSGLTAITNAVSGSDPSAGWRLWRSRGGSPWYLIATGGHATDAFTDTGIAGDCTVAPPPTNTVAGTYALTVTVPSAGQPAGAVNFNIYACTDGQFENPCLLGTYPVADYDAAQVYTTLTALSGAPPATSRCYPGAQQINPDTDLLNWTWKRAVANAAALPAVGNTDGDIRITLDTRELWVWNAGTTAWQRWRPKAIALNAHSTTGTVPTVALGAASKLDVATVDTDTEGWWDATNTRYTPLRAGWYRVRGFLQTGTTTTMPSELVIALNGALLPDAVSRVAPAAAGGTQEVNVVVHMNGTTDYLELFAGVNEAAINVGYASLAVQHVGD